MINKEETRYLIKQFNLDKPLTAISDKILKGTRISKEEGLVLYEKADLALLGVLANAIKEDKNADYVFYNKNLHIEPTNICIYNCNFCSYSKKVNTDGWELTETEILDKVKSALKTGITEVHIVGGVHPNYDLHYYGNIIKKIKEIAPLIHIKAFTAIELDYMIKKAGLSIVEGLLKLKEYGLNSIPGGGAEIFNEEVREKICGQKSTGEIWLKIHEAAHKLGIPSNATMLYGHIENYSHRIDHLAKLRELQDKTGLFNTFIPLKFKNKNNKLSYIEEVSLTEDLRNFAVSRIFLDNFDHLKAYWPMLGKETTQLALSFGVDDVDGTINDSTKIYSMAGSKEEHPSMTSQEMQEFISNVNRTPVERDSLYNIVEHKILEESIL